MNIKGIETANQKGSQNGGMPLRTYLIIPSSCSSESSLYPGGLRWCCWCSIPGFGTRCDAHHPRQQGGRATPGFFYRRLLQGYLLEAKDPKPELCAA